MHKYRLPMVNDKIIALSSSTISNHYSHYHLLIIFSSILSSAINAGLAARIALVSPPWIVLASAQRFFPWSVIGPFENAPCVLHLRFSLTAGALHCFLVLLDKAWHRLHRMRPAARVMNCSRSGGVWFDFMHRTSWTELVSIWACHSLWHLMARVATRLPIPVNGNIVVTLKFTSRGLNIRQIKPTPLFIVECSFSWFYRGT